MTLAKAVRGFDLAVGLFLGWCAFRSEWIRPGLVTLYVLRRLPG